MADAPWLVYLLQCADGSLYCGVARDMNRRLKQHNGQMPGGAKYTAGRRPVSLLACAEARSRRQAQQLELAIKKLPRQRKLAALQRLGATGAIL